MPTAAPEPKTVVLVAQLPCGTCVRIELTLRLADTPSRPATSAPLVIA